MKNPSFNDFNDSEMLREKKKLYAHGVWITATVNSGVWITVTIYFCLQLHVQLREKIVIIHSETKNISFHFIDYYMIVIIRCHLFMCQNHINKNKSNKFYFYA